MGRVNYISGAIGAKNNALYNLLVKKFVSLGARSAVAEWAATQAMYESAHGASNVAEENKNLSGIKYAGQAGAVPGTMSPEGNRYAKFDSLNSWAAAFVRELKKSPGKPWSESRDLQDYVSRLKANRYFTDDEGRYYNNMVAIYKMYNPSGPAPPVPVPGTPEYEDYQRSGQQRRDAEEDVRSGRYREQVWQHEQQIRDEIRAGIPQNRFEQWVDDASRGGKKALLIGGLALLGLIIITRR